MKLIRILGILVSPAFHKHYYNLLRATNKYYNKSLELSYAGFP